jgi:hypothetical protein
MKVQKDKTVKIQWGKKLNSKKSTRRQRNILQG